MNRLQLCTDSQHSGGPQNKQCRRSSYYGGKTVVVSNFDLLVVLASTRPKQLEDLVNLCRSCTARSSLRQPQPTRQRRLTPDEQAAVVQAYQAG